MKFIAYAHWNFERSTPRCEASDMADPEYKASEIDDRPT